MKELKISIIGSGWLGARLCYDLSFITSHINVSSRTFNENNYLKNKKIKKYIIDINNLKKHKHDFFYCDILIINIPSKNIKAFDDLIKYIQRYNIKKVIFISSTSIYDNNNCIIKEGDNNENKSKELYIIEDMFFSNKSFVTTSLRLGGLVGYSRHPGNFFKDGIVNDSSSYINLIHRDDCINIIIEIIKQNIWNEKFNCCSTTHPTKKDFYTYAAKQLNRELKFNDKDILNYKIISNEKLINKLNYTFVYEDLMKVRF